MKRIFFVLVLLFSVLVIPNLVSAQVNLHGSGHLHAEGNGRATLIMQTGNVHVSGHGYLVIAIRDNASIQLSGEGTCQDYEHENLTVKRCRGFNGEAHVAGNGFTVRIQGRDIVLDASGKGHARLRGEGWYETNSKSGSWSAEGQEVNITDNS